MDNQETVETPEVKEVPKNTAPRRKPPVTKAAPKKDAMKFDQVKALLNKKGKESRLKAIPFKVLRMTVPCVIECAGEPVNVKKGQYICLMSKQCFVITEDTYRDMVKLY